VSATFRDLTIPPEEAVVVLMRLEMLRKDTVAGFFPFTSPEGEYTTGLTDCYIDPIPRGVRPKTWVSETSLAGLAVSNLALV